MATSKNPTNGRKSKAKATDESTKRIDDTVSDAKVEPNVDAKKEASTVATPDETEPSEPKADGATQPEEEINAIPEIDAPENLPSPIVVHKTGFLPTVLGGVLAAVIGFGAARYVIPDGWPFGAPADDQTATMIAEQDARIESQNAKIAALESRIGTLPAKADLDAIEQSLNVGLSTLNEANDGLSAAVRALEVRLSEAEKAAATGDSDASRAAVAAFEREVAALRAEMTASQEEAQVLGESAKAAATAAKIDAAVLLMKAALESGGGFATALTDLREATNVEIPVKLVTASEAGVSTLQDLQQSYPSAARAALTASLKATESGSTANRFTSFLRSQTGARSLTVRDGDDPDAILSRAEAALNENDLAKSVSEISALPDAGQAAMADWVSAATHRIETIAAADALTLSLHSK